MKIPYTRTITCIKKNMYDKKLKYIAISYRWGELNEQQVETPDYTAHITSFDLVDLKNLCQNINKEPSLKKIRYLWIDAISVDQQNEEKRKKTILKMNQIYQNATCILAIPDLHKEYLLKNPANKEILDLIYYKYSKIIYDDIYNYQHEYQQQQQDTLVERIENKIQGNDEFKNNELKKVYQFLAYLIEEWSNRAWVISEYQIAKEKYKKHGIPLKYMFISLFQIELDKQPFFSYQFNDNDNYIQQQKCTINNENDDKNNNLSINQNVYDIKTFYQFVKSRFMQRPHLEMILNSNAKRNEDRFNAILPSWNRYSHLIKNVSDWNITDMTSVRLKLYEIMNDDDLWDKAKLLNACSSYTVQPMLPSFASHYNMDKLRIVEKCIYDVTYKEFEEKQLKLRIPTFSPKLAEKMKLLINEYETNSKVIWTENLISIRFEQQSYCLIVKSKSYFIKKKKHDSYFINHLKSKLRLDYNDEIHCVFLPFFTFPTPDSPYMYLDSSSINLVGNWNKNKWILMFDLSCNYRSEHFKYDDYTFNIY
ncbi:unnamed protein product [Cunninghamella blakesleeana]